MYDLNAILARLRQEDTEISSAVRGLTDCCCRMLKTAMQGDNAMLDLWHREQVLLRGSGETQEERCVINSLHTVYSIVMKCIAWSMVRTARGDGGMRSSPVRHFAPWGSSITAVRIGIVGSCGTEMMR